MSFTNAVSIHNGIPIVLVSSYNWVLPKLTTVCPLYLMSLVGQTEKCASLYSMRCKHLLWIDLGFWGENVPSCVCGMCGAFQGVNISWPLSGQAFFPSGWVLFPFHRVPAPTLIPSADWFENLIWSYLWACSMVLTGPHNPLALATLPWSKVISRVGESEAKNVVSFSREQEAPVKKCGMSGNSPLPCFVRGEINYCVLSP